MNCPNCDKKLTDRRIKEAKRKHASLYKQRNTENYNIYCDIDCFYEFKGWEMDRTKKFRTCPECGERKSRKSMRCGDCHAIAISNYRLDSEVKELVILNSGAGFDYFIDMTSNPDYFNVDFVNTNGTFIIGAEKWVTQVDFSKFLWKNITIKCPSPRDIHFQSCMETAVELIKTNKIKPKDLWGKEYHRDNAFEAFNDRLLGKERLRSYVTWK